MAPKKKIPDRWLDYRPVQNVLPDVKIVAFKTPLPESKFYSEQLMPFKWTSFDLMDYLRHQGWELGLIIDFTNKYPAYYDPEDFIRNGVDFLKIGCVGHDVPTDECFDKFCEAVEKFSWYERQNNRVIGVHCTHGVNRTGYMVCRYLIQKRGYTPDQALRAFAEMRGYPVERENYIQELYKLNV